MLKVFFSLLFLPLFLFGEDLKQVRAELESKRSTPSKQKSIELLNVSYDATKEFYDDYNELFAQWWKERTGQDVSVVQSHGGSGKQARSIISGLEADVVSLALAYDIDEIEKATCVIGKGWQARLPNNSSPYYSTIVFLVRKGNPKKIKDWEDLTREGVGIVFPNPKTSGGARWIYLAAWGYARDKYKGDIPKTIAFMKKMYGNAPVLDTGARGSTTTFIQRHMGDVLLTWENEAYLIKEKMGMDQYEIVYPSMSIKAEPPVAWIDKFIREKGTEDAAKFYLKYLYSVPAQKLIAKHHFRPYGGEDKTIKMVTVADFGGWERVQEVHFKNHGIFDEIYLQKS